jgi:hypothetical protein
MISPSSTEVQSTILSRSERRRMLKSSCQKTMKPPQDLKTLPIQETENEARHLSTGEDTMMVEICRLNAGEGGQGLHEERWSDITS